jgi:hypothetical protein
VNLGPATRKALRVPVAAWHLLLLDWRRAEEQPSPPPADRRRPKPSPMQTRPWRWGVLGAVIGFVIHPVTLILSYRAEYQSGDVVDLRALGYIAFGLFIATPVSMIVGIALAWGPRFRPIGLGLTIGATAGALAGMSWLLLAMTP